MSDEAVAAELGQDYDLPCSQLTYKADIQNAKMQILEGRKIELIHGSFKIFVFINFNLPNGFNIYFTAFASAYDRDMQSLMKQYPDFIEKTSNLMSSKQSIIIMNKNFSLSQL